MKKGIVYSILASLVFSLMNLFVKLVSKDIPSIEIVFFRSLVGSIITYCLMKKHNVKFSKDNRSILFLRGLCGSLYLISYFYIISVLPLADVSILINLSPFFVIVFSAIILKEKIGRLKYLMLFVALAGTIITINPTSFNSYSIIALIGVFSAICSAGASISIRHLSKTKNSYEIIFYFLFMALIVSTPMMWNKFIVPDLYELTLLILIGTVSYLGQYFLTKAYTYEKAPIVAGTRYISIAFNVFWGLVIWGEIPKTTTIFGGSMIVFACIYLALYKDKKIEDEKVVIKKA